MSNCYSTKQLFHSCFNVLSLKLVQIPVVLGKGKGSETYHNIQEVTSLMNEPPHILQRNFRIKKLHENFKNEHKHSKHDIIFQNDENCSHVSLQTLKNKNRKRATQTEERQYCEAGELRHYIYMQRPILTNS